MKLIYTDHLRGRMQGRGISDAELREALAGADTAYSTPRGSTCIVGSTVAGRVLKIWVVGHVTIPLDKQKLILKSVAGKDEEDE